jgi:hypothetical protein
MIKKSSFTFFVCILFLTGAFAQNKTHTIGIYISPQANILDYKIDHSFLPGLQDVEVKGNGMCFSQGIYYQAKFNKLGLWVGLGYSKMNNYTQSSGILDDNSTMISNSKVEKSFLSIPVAFFYDFYQKNVFSIGANAGLSVECLVATKRYWKDETGYYSGMIQQLPKITEGFVHRLNLSAFIGIDFKWTFVNGIGLSVTPTCSYYFTNTIPSERNIGGQYIKERYINVGIIGKIFYTLK